MIKPRNTSAGGSVKERRKPHIWSMQVGAPDVRGHPFQSGEPEGKNCHRYVWSNMQTEYQIGKETEIWLLIIRLKEACAYRIREDDDSKEIGDITFLKTKGKKYTQRTQKNVAPPLTAVRTPALSGLIPARIDKDQSVYANCHQTWVHRLISAWPYGGETREGRVYVEDLQ